MTLRARSVLLVLPATLAVVASSACASPKSATASTAETPAARPARVDRSVLTRDLMLKNRFSTVYDAVAALRSLWLRPRGPESFSLALEVLVYLDDNPLGGVETLRNIQPNLVSTVRFYDGPSATSRWGVGHGAGVIHVSTWSNGALGMPGSERSSRDSSSGRPDSTARPDSAAKPRRP